MPRFLGPLAALCLALLPAAGGAGALEREIAAARAAVAPYADFNRARADGWEPFGGDELLMGQHWYNDKGPDFVTGDPFDPTRPSNLMYSRIDGRMQLVALSYNVRFAVGDPLPTGFTGNSDVWHVHDARVFFAAALQDRPIMRWFAEAWFDSEIVQKDGKTRLAMVHLWLIPNPDGRFSPYNRLLAYRKLGLPDDWARGAGMDAARGLAMAAPNGCEDALDSQFWVANVRGRQERELRSVCAQLAAYVREGLSAGAREANGRGAQAWRRMEAELDRRLSLEQRLRIASMSDQGLLHGN